MLLILYFYVFIISVAGILLGLEKVGWSDVPVVLVSNPRNVFGQVFVHRFSEEKLTHFNNSGADPTIFGIYKYNVSVVIG
jgi:hypothetical protein